MDMDRNVAAFRERFNAYKNGKSVSEIYDAGLPRYDIGKVSEQVSDDVIDFIINNEGGYTGKLSIDPGNGAESLDGINVKKYIDQFKKTGRWTLQDHRNAIREIVASNRQHIRKKLSNYNSLTKDQQKALDDIVFNIGSLDASPEFVSAVLAGDMDKAKSEMDWGNNQKDIYGRPLRGLRSRNSARQALWGNTTITPLQQQQITTVPDAVKVVKTIPQEQTIPAYNTKVSPYISGKPMIHLQPRIKLPNLLDMLDDEWEPTIGFKNGKLPEYGDGTGLAGLIRNTIYKNIDPHGYNIPKAITQFLSGEREYNMSGMKEALWAKYLGRDKYNTYTGEGDVDDWIVPAQYSPTVGSSTYTAYRLNPEKFNYSHAGSSGGPLSDENIRLYFQQRLKSGKNNITTDDGFPNSGMGYYTMGSGQDENGKFVSYYDDWDINPLHGKSAQSWTKIFPDKLKNMGDILQGVLGTNPYTLYDRRYLTDEEWKALGGYKNGKLPYFSNGKSPIHIKPANRGKFTALKKRTGHSASWFKENGTPAQKKMAVFALNAKKWHHADGKLPKYEDGKDISGMNKLSLGIE